MNKGLQKGTLVWITPRVGLSSRPSTTMMERHGNLWVVDSKAMAVNDTRPKWYWCKSISTGYLYDWREDEMEVHETKEPNNVRQEEGATTQ